MQYIVYEALTYLGETDTAWRFIVQVVGYIDHSGKPIYVERKNINGDDEIQTHSIAKQILVGTEKVPHPDNPRRTIERDKYQNNRRPSFIDKIPHWRKSNFPVTWHDLKKEFPAAFGLEDIEDADPEFEQKRQEALEKAKLLEEREKLQ